MWRTILDLFTYPGRTLDRFLAEKSLERSTQTFFFSMLVISLSMVLSAYLAQKGLARLKPYSIAMAAITPIAGLLILRLLFQMLIKTGVRLVANKYYPVDRQQRKERSRELYLLFPYHVIPAVLPAVVFPFVFAPAASDSMHLLAKLLLMIGYILLLCGTVVFQIALMTMIVKRVYQVPTALAFWGPMLAYLLLGIVIAIISLVLSIGFSLINLR